MKLFPLYGHGWESNCYLLISGSEALLIDAGIEPGHITELLAQENAHLSYIVLTHGHFDHTISVDKLREKTGAKLLIHTNDADMLADAEKSALYYFFGTRNAYRPAERLLQNGDEILLGEERLGVIHTPGHSQGSICLLANDMLFTGDTLFDGSYGRCDLYGGSTEALVSSLLSLKTLPPISPFTPGTAVLLPWDKHSVKPLICSHNLFQSSER